MKISRPCRGGEYADGGGDGGDGVESGGFCSGTGEMIQISSASLDDEVELETHT